MCVFSEPAMIVYISRGLLSSLTEARPVLDAISEENALTGHRVVINTYAVIDGEDKLYLCGLCSAAVLLCLHL